MPVEPAIGNDAPGHPRRRKPGTPRSFGATASGRLSVGRDYSGRQMNFLTNCGAPGITGAEPESCIRGAMRARDRNHHGQGAASGVRMHRAPPSGRGLQPCTLADAPSAGCRGCRAGERAPGLPGIPCPGGRQSSGVVPGDRAQHLPHGTRAQARRPQRHRARRRCPGHRSHGAGGSFIFDPTYIHGVRHPGADAPPATSIHCYSPALWRMGHYEPDESGVMRRVAVTYADELLGVA